MRRWAPILALVTSLVTAGLALPSAATAAGPATNVAIVSGSPQTVPTGLAFAPLKVKVTDDAASPVSGVQVTFTVWQPSGVTAGGTFPNGTSTGTAVSDANGLATAPTFKANSAAGSYEVDATIPGGMFTSFSLTNVIDTTPPAVTLSKPLSNVTLATRILVAWSATDTYGVASYDVRYRKATWYGLFGPYVYWLTATTWPAAYFTGTYGADYCFSVRARDRAGNVSGWTTQRCTAIPLDDRSLVASTGWKRLTGASFFHATMTQSSTVGSKLTRTGVRRGRMALVATRAPGFGTVAVLYNGRLVRKVSLAAATTQRRSVIGLPYFSASTGTVVIKLITAKRVQIDGLVAARI